MDNYINCFPGYEFVRSPDDNKMHNMYRGVDLGFGGYVYAEPGMYANVALIDAASMHPTSIVLLNKLGKYTKVYSDLRLARVLIKHKEYDKASVLFNGKLAKYLENEEDADSLSSALKLPLNSFFGTSFAGFENPARDSRDKNNIIALRGALFMKTLQDEVVKKGFSVVHIKTDSIKVPNSTPEIVQFIIDFGKKYGYEMEHEATYDRMCLVNDAVYIAKYDEHGIRNKGGKHANEWTATGAQFAQPYVFKTLFSHEPVVFDDMCETKSTKTALYLDMNEDLPEGEHDYQFIGKVGQFTPIKPGCGGGLLYRGDASKFDSVTGTKGWRWLESEIVRSANKENDVDLNYYRALIDKAVETISKFGSFDAFVAEGKYVDMNFMNVPETEDEEIPWK